MAFLADPGAASLRLSTWLKHIPLDWNEWLLAVFFVVLLTITFSLQGLPVGREQAALRGTGVCEKQAFPPLSLFFLAH